MVRSFHYAAGVAMRDDPETTSKRRAWLRFWRHWISVAFLRAYFSAVDRDVLPRNRDDLQLMFQIQLFERTLYELGHELGHRPEWVGIPLADLKEMLDSLQKTAAYAPPPSP
jgi:maltose alpha-D-glucosyltransferase/alpha-amylase